MQITFFVTKYAKIALKSFVPMPNRKLPTNFQLNKARAQHSSKKCDFDSYLREMPDFGYDLVHCDKMCLKPQYCKNSLKPLKNH